LAWQFNSTEAVFVQIAHRLRKEILVGKYPPNSQFPTVRQLAYEAAVNPNTVQRALYTLEQEGLLYTQGTVGRFVTSDTEVLERAAEYTRRETVRRLVEESRAMGISRDDLIKYIKEESNNG